jgi:anti-sigma factor RsiW
MNCTCAEFEILLCDAVDEKLRGDARAMFDAHRASCPACQELAADVLGATAFLERVADVEPPKELLTKILFETAGNPAKQASPARSWWRSLFGPILQPKLAMGLTMTVLSISMLAQVFGIELRQMKASDLEPARIVAGVEDGVHRGWTRVVKYYENIRVVYEIQSRLKEWADQEELERQQQSQSSKTQTTPPSGR